MQGNAIASCNDLLDLNFKILNQNRKGVSPNVYFFCKSSFALSFGQIYWTFTHLIRSANYNTCKHFFIRVIFLNACYELEQVDASNLVVLL